MPCVLPAIRRRVDWPKKFWKISRVSFWSRKFWLTSDSSILGRWISLSLSLLESLSRGVTLWLCMCTVSPSMWQMAVCVHTYTHYLAILRATFSGASYSSTVSAFTLTNDTAVKTNAYFCSGFPLLNRKL